VKAAQRISFEDIRLSLWFAPSVAAVVSLAVALGLSEVAPGEDSLLGRLPWPADVEAASTTLQVIATSIITVTSLTFSLVVVALQLASQQFSPRLLREFARDWVIQVVLAILVSTFVFALTILLALDTTEPVPKLAVLVAYLLGLSSVAALLTFLGHIVRALRIDTMMVAVHGETAATIAQSYPSLQEPEPARPDPEANRSGGKVVPARRSGFVKVIKPAGLVRAAAEADAVLWMLLRPGDHLVEGTPVGVAYRRDGSPATQQQADRLADAILSAVELGYERTSEQDAALGLRQLVDIAVKALSPGINDPVTAAHAVGYLSDLLVRLQSRRLGPQAHADAEGTARLVLPDRDIRYYLDLACGQIRRYGRREPTVLVALLRMLRDAAVSAPDDHHRDEIRRQSELIVAEMSGDLHAEDAATVHDVAARVEQALGGQVEQAFSDRAGETRSI
jgi:uncharacterized membrane protein